MSFCTEETRATSPTLTDRDRAASETIINPFLEMEIDSVVGARRAWVNVTRDVPLSDVVRVAAKRVVVE